MGRIRTVKPELFLHEELFELEQSSSLPVRLAFIGLFTACDREGRFRWKPKQLKLAIMPWDRVDFEAVLNALCEGGYVLKYEADGDQLGCIPSWRRHQVIGPRERKSNLPAPPCNCTETAVQPHCNAHDGRELEGKGTGREKEKELEGNWNVEGKGIARGLADLIAEARARGSA